MAGLTGGKLVAKTLATEGVQTIFTLCGAHVMDIYSGCLDEGIRIIDVRHEQTAAHAADAWTRLTGVPGVAVVTAGPGATDAVTGVANAYRAQVPMLLIGGQAPIRNLLKGGLQEMNSVDMMRPITKFSGTVFDTVRIPEMIGLALREACNGRPGPSFLEIPQDVLDREVEEGDVQVPVQSRSQCRLTGDRKLVARAAELLAKAQRPALIAGTQVWSCRAVKPLRLFVERAGIPTYLNGAARGCLPVDSPHAFNRPESTRFPRPTSCWSSALRSTSGLDTAAGSDRRQRSSRSTSTTRNFVTTVTWKWPYRRTRVLSWKRWRAPCHLPEEPVSGSTSCGPWKLSFWRGKVVF